MPLYETLIYIGKYINVKERQIGFNVFVISKSWIYFNYFYDTATEVS